MHMAMCGAGAPAIKEVGSGVEVLAYLERDGAKVPVAVAQGNKLGLTFHPELSGDARSTALNFSVVVVAVVAVAVVAVVAYVAVVAVVFVVLVLFSLPLTLSRKKYVSALPCGVIA